MTGPRFLVWICPWCAVHSPALIDCGDPYVLCNACGSACIFRKGRLKAIDVDTMAADVRAEIDRQHGLWCDHGDLPRLVTMAEDNAGDTFAVSVPVVIEKRMRCIVRIDAPRDGKLYALSVRGDAAECRGIAVASWWMNRNARSAVDRVAITDVAKLPFMALQMQAGDSLSIELENWFHRLREFTMKVSLVSVKKP